MKLAINYSTQAAGLLAEGRIQTDYFKCPDWPHLIAAARPYAPVAVHFSLTAGSGHLDHNADWALVERLLAETGTPFVNLHIDPDPKDYPELKIDESRPERVIRLLENTAIDLAAAVHRFGASKVIAENSPYKGNQGNVLRIAVEPEVIHSLVEEAGCGLLLDLSHARLSAQHIGMAEWEYISGLPVQRLCEMHFTGIQEVDGHLFDHLPALPADWQALDRALSQVRQGLWRPPWMLAFEYGGVGGPFAWRSEVAPIAEQMPILYRKVREI